MTLNSTERENTYVTDMKKVKHVELVYIFLREKIYTKGIR